MKIIYSWLIEFLPFSLSSFEISELLTNIGHEVEGVYKEEGEEIIEVSITPNRGDCLSYLGIAREICAYLKEQVKFPKFSEEEPQKNKITINSQSCKVYSYRIIKNIENKESPSWLKKRLILSDIKPYNLIVDITNYVTLELGNPSHAFDLSFIKNTIIVEDRKVEEFLALDNKEYFLKENVCCICDKEGRIHALGGIIGSKYSQITQETKDVLIEVAYFTPSSVRMSSKSLGIQTNSCYLFERGVDFGNIIKTQQRIGYLIKELVPHSEVFEINIEKKEIKEKNIKLRFDFFKKISGISIEKEKIIEILNSLGFELKNLSEGWIEVSVPTWRYHDISKEADIVEEVLRFWGYQKLSSLVINPKVSSFFIEDKKIKKIKQLMTSCGFYEVKTIPFAKDGEVRIKNPLQSDIPFLRGDFVSSFLKVIKENFDKKNFRFMIFEIGKLFLKEKETEALGVCLSTAEKERFWYKEERVFDFFYLKGVVERLFLELGTEAEFKEAKEDELLCEPLLFLYLDNKIIGKLGKIREEITKKFKIKENVYYFQLNLEEIKEKEKVFKQLPKFPEITRDISIIIDKELRYENIEKIIKEVGGELIEDVILFDVYESKELPEDKKNISLSIIYRSREKTLESEFINSLTFKIIENLQKKLGAKLREKS